MRELLKVKARHGKVATERRIQEVTTPRRLKVVSTKIVRLHTQELLDTGTVPDILSTRLCALCSLKLEKSGKGIKITDMSTALTLKSMKEVSVSITGCNVLLYLFSLTTCQWIR